MSVDGQFAIHISENPEDIAKKMVEDLIQPVLGQKMAHSGEVSAGTLYLSLMYFLARTRVGLIGHDAVHELHGLASEIEEDCFDENGDQLKDKQDLTQFVQLDGKPS